MAALGELLRSFGADSRIVAEVFLPTGYAAREPYLWKVSKDQRTSATTGIGRGLHNTQLGVEYQVKERLHKGRTSEEAYQLQVPRDSVGK